MQCFSGGEHLVTLYLGDIAAAKNAARMELFTPEYESFSQHVVDLCRLVVCRADSVIGVASPVGLGKKLKSHLGSEACLTTAGARDR